MGIASVDAMSPLETQASGVVSMVLRWPVMAPYRSTSASMRPCWPG